MSGSESTASLERILAAARESGATDVCLAGSAIPMLRQRGSWIPMTAVGRIETSTLCDWIHQIVPEASQSQLQSDYHTVFLHTSQSASPFTCRVTLHQQREGGTVAFRFLPPSPPTLEELSAPSSLLGLLSYRSGLILLGGGAASGRSLLLYSALERINADSNRKILALGYPPEFALSPRGSRVETLDLSLDPRPVERILESVRYRDVDVLSIDFPLNRAALLETLQLAQSGVLVLATGYGSSSGTMLEDMVDLVASDQRAAVRVTLSETFLGVIVQGLATLRDGSRQIPLHEILLRSRPAADAIREGKWEAIPKIMTIARQDGMRLLADSLEEAVQKNLIAGEEAFNLALLKTRFLQYGPEVWRIGTT